MMKRRAATASWIWSARWRWRRGAEMETRIGWDLTLAALLLSLALSMILSWVYVATYHGLSYVRSFANTIAIAGVVSSIVMLAIGDDVARGIGLVGALT